MFIVHIHLTVNTFFFLFPPPDYSEFLKMPNGNRVIHHMTRLWTPHRFRGITDRNRRFNSQLLKVSAQLELFVLLARDCLIVNYRREVKKDFSVTKKVRYYGEISVSL